jgi:hypothetical protein
MGLFRGLKSKEEGCDYQSEIGLDDVLLGLHLIHVDEAQLSSELKE